MPMLIVGNDSTRCGGEGPCIDKIGEAVSPGTDNATMEVTSVIMANSLSHP